MITYHSSGSVKFKNLFLILLILLLAFSLRLYRVDRPFTGLHSWKEVNSAMKTRHFYEGEPLFLPQIDYYRQLDSPDNGYIYQPFPIESWLGLIFWKLFGPSEWAARLPIVLISTLTVWVVYLLSQILLGRKRALWAAFIYSILPLNVYFGQNFQLDPIMVLFLAVSLWLMAKWSKEGKRWLLAFALAAGILAILTKVVAWVILTTALIGTIAWRKNNFKLLSKKWWFNSKQVGLAAIGSTILIAPYLISNFLQKTIGQFLLSQGNTSDIQFLNIFSPELHLLRTPTALLTLQNYFTIVNFFLLSTGVIFGFLALLGLWILIKNMERRGECFFLFIITLGNLIFLILAFRNFAFHIYYQLPLMLPVALLASIGIAWIVNRAKGDIRFQKVLFISLIIIIPLSIAIYSAKIAGRVNPTKILDHIYEDTSAYAKEYGEFLKRNTPKDAIVLYKDDPTFLYYAERIGINLASVQNRLKEALNNERINYVVLNGKPQIEKFYKDNPLIQKSTQVIRDDESAILLKIVHK